MYADIRFRNDGIDGIARAKAARDILAALPEIWTKNLIEENFGAEEGLHTRATLPTDCCHLNDPAARINCYHRHDATIREENMVEWTIGVHENLPALATNVLKLRHKSREIARWQGK